MVHAGERSDDYNRHLSTSQLSFKPISTRAQSAQSNCKRHVPCELCFDSCPPNCRIGCRCSSTATARTCTCPQTLGTKCVTDTFKQRLRCEQLKARSVHGQPGLLGENRQISRRDRFCSTYNLAFNDPDGKGCDFPNQERAAGLETMRVPTLPERGKPVKNICCNCDQHTPRERGDAGNLHDQCAYCGFTEGARDFRPKIRRSIKIRENTLRSSNLLESGWTTAKSAGSQGFKVTDDFLVKLNRMEEDLSHLNDQILTELKDEKGKQKKPKHRTGPRNKSHHKSSMEKNHEKRSMSQTDDTTTTRKSSCRPKTSSTRSQQGQELKTIDLASDS